MCLAASMINAQKATRIRGNTLTEFMVNNVLEAAERTMKYAEFMELTHRDRVAFAKALSTAPASPNAKLRIPAKVNADSEGNVDGIPGRRRTVFEA